MGISTSFFMLYIARQARLSVKRILNKSTIYYSHGDPSKLWMPDLQWFPWKLCLIKDELDINVFVSLNCLFSFAVSPQKWLAFRVKEAMEKLAEMNTFRVVKTTVSSTFLIRFMFKGYRWKLDMASLEIETSLEITLPVPLID